MPNSPGRWLLPASAFHPPRGRGAGESLSLGSIDGNERVAQWNKARTWDTLRSLRQARRCTLPSVSCR